MNESKYPGFREKFGVFFVGRAASSPPTVLDHRPGKAGGPAIDHRRHCEERSDVAISLGVEAVLRHISTDRGIATPVRALVRNDIYF